jgi:hypothetical protein
VPATSVRWLVVSHLVDLFRAEGDLDGVLVEPGWPGDQRVRAETIWLDRIDNVNITIPVMTGGRKQRDDMFTLPFQVRVAGRHDLDQTMARVMELLAAVENVLADDPTLGDFTGVVSAEITSERQSVGTTPEGCIGFGEVIVTVHTRLN